MAFLIEALVVLAFLMTSLAVFVRLFSGAQVEGLRANELSQAVLAASVGAERFAADPTQVQEFTTEDGLSVSYEVKETPHGTGTLYNATVVVSHDGAQVYTLETARYVSAAEGGAQ